MGSDAAYTISAMPAVIGLVVAVIIDNIKRKNDLVTYMRFLHCERRREHRDPQYSPTWLGRAAPAGVRLA